MADLGYAPPPDMGGYAVPSSPVPQTANPAVQVTTQGSQGYQYQQWPQTPGEKPAKSHWSGWTGMIIAIIAMIFVVLALVLLIANNTRTTIFPNMNVIVSNTTGSQTVVLDGNDVFVNTGGALNLTVNVPVPGTGYTTGQAFIIDNARGTGDITVTFGSGVTLYPASANTGQSPVIPAGMSSQFIWISQTEIHQYWMGPSTQ